GNEIISNFEGVGNLNSVYPPDTEGDVSPDHYFQMINLSFQIFDKQGNSLYGPADNRTLWNGFIGSWTSTNDGDPVILYDEQADRWVATQFAINTPDGTYWELVAVTETGDPLGSWFRYAFQFPVFNDYPKMGIWPDGYYFSFNMFGGDYRRAAVCALERDAMLVGDSNARMILFDMPDGSEPWSLLPADFDGTPPPDGTPDYFAYAMDDAYGSGDYLSIWAFRSDWENPENSTFEEVTKLNTEPFNSWFCDASLGSCIPQPDGGPNLEALSDRLMYRLQYRNFGDYQVMVTNHTVNADGNGHAGIRWYEMRDLNDGNGWFIYQQGTYAPDEHHRWMGSVAMNGKGYIALGFSIVSGTKYPSICYTGRSPNDPLGQMTFYEEEIMAGSGVQTGPAARWGDYSMMSIDPVDDTTFWFTTEYVKQTGQVSWRTRIAGFTMVEDHISPAEVNDLAALANTTNSITLQWTASGDNGISGTAFLYDIRYSTESITPENFEAAIQAENEPSPAEAGNTESFTIKDLDFSTRYYFAMKVRDRQFNFSGLSNIVQATTPGSPEIAVQETAIEQKLFPGSMGTRDYNIENTGASDIYFRILKDTVNSRGQGDIRGIYENSTNAVSGLAWVGNELLMIDMQKNYLFHYDTAMQQLTDTVIIHSSPYGLVWDGENLWIGDKNGHVLEYTLDGIPTGASFNCPTASYSSLAWDGEYFLTNFILESDPVIYRIDETGEVISSFKTDLDHMRIWQLTWADEHLFSGEVWFTNNSGVIGQIKLEDGTGNLIKQFPAPASVSYAITHDHSDLWYGKTGGILYRIDDGIDEVNWLKVDPEISAIPAGSVNGINLRFDAGMFDEGNHHANMIILSNDEDEPEIRVPVDMLVTGISIGPDTSFCGHLSIMLDAGEGFAGYLWSDGSTGQTNEVDSTLYGIGFATFWVDVTDLGGTIKRDSISINFFDCTSIFEFASGLKVTVYPNPNRGTFNIRAEGLNGTLSLSISDMTGKMIWQREMTSQSEPAKEITVDLTSHPKGHYLLRLSSGEGIKVEKVVVY
ncbi:MAG: T9SS type A sorting domain-containing protein, partial [Bacteroidales bacterium]